MANPFNIDSLNGVSFELDNLGSFQTPAADPDSAAAVAPRDFSISRIAITGVEDTYDPGMITVLSNAYTAGSLVTGVSNGPDIEDRYYLPTFGALQFSNYVDADGNPITLWVHGFSENGLLLTLKEDAYWYGASGSDLTSFYGAPAEALGGQEQGVVFGVYGVYQYGNYNHPNSVGYAGAPVRFDRDATIFCFVEGTLIATALGSVAVEDLSVGDLVVTASGAQRPIKWIGQTASRPARHRRPHEVNPVRVRAHAFGPNLPKRDLRLSPGHAVYVDGVLVPISHLVNGATIVQDQVEKIRYFHVELEAHDIILAEGLPCESYLNDGNRWSATNVSEFAELYGRLDPKSWDEACAPLVAEGPQLVAIQQRLRALAEEQGWRLCENPELSLTVDGGAEILPVRREGNRYWFEVSGASSVTLRSNSAVLAHVMPGLSDLRRLGVALADLRIDGEAVELDSDRFGMGFYGVERHDGTAWRWTDGAGVVALDERGTTILEMNVAMVAPSWRRDVEFVSIAA
ncbi:MAG: hypothetical protein CVT77_03305 [Alphaproteobacteria bacterium HGW-Alphaproteobacteria-16]|nr:MAG: hypothetical protein CVT77_03305 [Alphaproteobacteria bacterium HGW-Alphaproteobacteria-16]